MLHSYGLRFKPWTDYAQIIRSEIVRAAQRPVDFNDHSLLNAQQSGEKSEGPFVEYLHALYAENPPDLIMALQRELCLLADRRVRAETPTT